MAAVDENLRAFLLADSTVSRLCGGRVHENHVPQNTLVPFLFFSQENIADEMCLNDSAGSGPFRHIYAVECIDRSLRKTRDLAAAVYSRLHKYVGAFGDTTVQGIFVDASDDEYIPRGVSADSGFHVTAMTVEVVP